MPYKCKNLQKEKIGTSHKIWLLPVTGAMAPALPLRIFPSSSDGMLLPHEFILHFYAFTFALSFWAKLEIKLYGLTASHSPCMKNVRWCVVGSRSDPFCVQS